MQNKRSYLSSVRKIYTSL